MTLGIGDMVTLGMGKYVMPIIRWAIAYVMGNKGISLEDLRAECHQKSMAAEEHVEREVI